MSAVDVLAVLDLPVYRELQDGEVIGEGDELLIFGQWKAQWDHVDRNAVGRVWRDGMAVTRRRIDTSAARAAVAELIEAAEGARTVLGIVYGKYQRRIGPYASQANSADWALHAALARCKGEQA